MPYLSRIRINPLRSGAQPLLKNPHRMKIQVLGGVPDPSPDAPVLWRLDAHDPHRPHLLVLTHEKPSWDHIVESVGWPGADGEDFLVRDYEPLLAQLAVGREFAFRLTANPVQNTTRPENPTRHQKEVMEKAVSDPERKRLRGFRMGHRTARRGRCAGYAGTGRTRTGCTAEGRQGAALPQEGFGPAEQQAAGHPHHRHLRGPTACHRPRSAAHDPAQRVGARQTLRMWPADTGPFDGNGK